MDTTTQPNPGQVPPPVMNPNPMTSPAHEHKPIGPIIGALIIVLVLIIGALYIWGQKLNLDEQKKAPETTEQTATTSDESASVIQSIEASLGDIDDLNF